MKKTLKYSTFSICQAKKKEKKKRSPQSPNLTSKIFQSAYIWSLDQNPTKMEKQRPFSLHAVFPANPMFVFSLKPPF